MMRWLTCGAAVVAAVALAGCSTVAPASGSAPSGAASATATAVPTGAASPTPSDVASGVASPAPSGVASGTPGPGRSDGCAEAVAPAGGGFPEVQGTARDAELWGLLFVKKTPLHHGDEIKIVWRMTGEGPLRVKATLPDGAAAKLVWGPEQHDGSTWRRPGQEWGTGFVFPKPGCWKVELTRTRGSGHVWLAVD
ncbi:hypothetical protein E1292_10825 [Nonomuraea deserti]|uniref:DUF2914 domain-containing protein n=1 Tax=Nonomuraea deserti TaxID=1848322 RepID=A0A4R4VZ74_9ACTN|nr:hypothetical protein [Nonomuraea deserti]TDD08803.1 hypothetical protein E1292_10825 [Nonomuraea deserti]